jgi:hypothetical protein
MRIVESGLGRHRGWWFGLSRPWHLPPPLQALPCVLYCMSGLLRLFVVAVGVSWADADRGVQSLSPPRVVVWPESPLAPPPPRQALPCVLHCVTGLLRLLVVAVGVSWADVDRGVQSRSPPARVVVWPESPLGASPPPPSPPTYTAYQARMFSLCSVFCDYSFSPHVSLCMLCGAGSMRVGLPPSMPQAASDMPLEASSTSALAQPISYCISDSEHTCLVGIERSKRRALVPMELGYY